MSAQEAALGRLWDLTLLLADDSERGLAEHGLTRSRAQVVWQLRQHGPVTQQALSTALGVTARNITGLVDGLVATGFVTREPHPTDRRATLVTFTPQGEARVAAMEASQKAFAETLFAEIPDAELAAFTSTLDHLRTRLRALAAPNQG